MTRLSFTRIYFHLLFSGGFEFDICRYILQFATPSQYLFDTYQALSVCAASGGILASEAHALDLVETMGASMFCDSGIFEQYDKVGFLFGGSGSDSIHYPFYIFGISSSDTSKVWLK
jgi:hypothetical protein